MAMAHPQAFWLTAMDVNLSDYMTCDLATGELVWTVSRGRKAAGMPVGSATLEDEYTRFRLLGKKHFTHRAVWWFATGRWPSGHIDHINGDKRDNRLCNLRDVDHSTNMQNKRHAMRTSSTGALGVYARRGRYCAQIQVNGRSMYLGDFATIDEGRAAYVTAKRQLHEGGTL